MKELTEIPQLSLFIRSQEVIPEEYLEEKRQRSDKKRELLLSSGLMEESGLSQVKQIRAVLEDHLGMIFF